MDREFQLVDRRKVIKTIGAGVVGGTFVAGPASAGDTGDERNQESFTWESNALWEMLESEPPHAHPKDTSKLVEVFEEIEDSEGSDEAHEPIWVVGSMAGTGIAGSEHSPHFGIPGHPILAADHVITFSKFNPQWHIHFVVDPDQPIVIVTFPDGSTGPFPNLVSVVDDTPLTSESRISSAVSDGDVLVMKTADPPAVFTCPVRPHQHKG